MKDLPAYKAAAMHVSPIFLDAAKTVDKACSLIRQAAAHGAQLVVFPEAYIPAFPLWGCLRAPGQNNEFFRRLSANAIHVPGPEIERIARTAKDCGVLVSVGITEGTATSPGCLWNSNLLIGPDGRLLNHHRKIAPTFYEKLIWTNGDGAGLKVVETELGRIGALICAENANALARHTMMAQGEQVHLMSFPPMWIGRGDDVEKIIRSRAESHCMDAKVFCVVASAYLADRDKDIIADGDPNVRAMMDGPVRPQSMILSPTAALLSPVMQDEEGIAYADVDLEACVVPKQFLDFTGNVSRFDIFTLTVDRTQNTAVIFAGERRDRPHVGDDLTFAKSPATVTSAPRSHNR